MTAPSSIQSVGYIGLGIMGSPMASNLLKAGYRMTVYNRTQAKCQALQAQGAKVVDSPMAVAAQDVDVICINVTDTPHVEQLLFGEAGIAKAAKPGLIIIDHSTISPVSTQAFAKTLAKQQVSYLDAPVSGGDLGAKNATLSIMVGGDEKNFEKCLPLFQAVGKNITLLGPIGMGQVCKACNQIAVVNNLLGVCEAMALAKKSGLDLDKMIQVVNGGAAGSWQLQQLGPKIASRDFDPGFMIDLVVKDLNIVLDTAEKQEIELKGTQLAQSYFQEIISGDLNGGRLGTQAMARVLENLGDFRFDQPHTPQPND